MVNEEISPNEETLEDRIEVEVGLGALGTDFKQDRIAQKSSLFYCRANGRES